MTRVIVVVEGQTEESFVKNVVAPILWPCAVFLIPMILGRPGHKGGNTKYARFKRDVILQLKQCRRQTNKTKRPIRKMACLKGIIGISLSPFKLDQVRIRRNWAKVEIVEKRCGQPHNIADFFVGGGVSALNAIEEGRQVLSTRPEEQVVIDGPLATNTGSRARVMKVIHDPTGDSVKNIVGHSMLRC